MSVLQLITEQWQQQSVAEVFAVALALAYVVLAAKQSRWCWPAAFISTGIYIGLYWENALPLQSVLNAYYLLMAVYGWWRWRSGSTNAPLTVSQRPMQFHLVAVLLLSAAVYPLAWLSHQQLGLVNLVDAAVTVFSVFTTWLVAQKVLENWLYWFVINTAAVWLNWQVEMYLSSLLMLMYLSMSVYGYFAWRKDIEPGLVNGY